MAFGAFQTAAPAGTQAPVAHVQRKSPVALWLLLPGILQHEPEKPLTPEPAQNPEIQPNSADEEENTA